MSSKKLAEKIIKSLRDKGYIDGQEIQRFVDLKREDGKEVIRHLIELSDRAEVKRRLYEIHNQNHYRYDPRLEILMIWLALDPSVQKSFNPKNII